MVFEKGGRLNLREIVETHDPVKTLKEEKDRRVKNGRESRNAHGRNGENRGP